jgi:long-subunit acyl-CoA synthetase (AMP-forming)
MVHGQNKPFNVAVIVVDKGKLTDWAKEKGLSTDSMPELLKRPEDGFRTALAKVALKNQELYRRLAR